jgi:uncharacterized protein (DUF433 family)
MYQVKDHINIDQEILAGNPVFKGTRVPIQTLFDHLEKGIPLGEFLADFPTVSKDHAIAVIEIASKILTSKNIEQIYEAAAWRESSKETQAGLSRTWGLHRRGQRLDGCFKWHTAHIVERE